MGRLARITAVVIAVMAITGIILLYEDYIAGAAGAELIARSVNFFSFFTIESNLLIAGLTGAAAAAPGSRAAAPIGKPAVAGAACLYIVVTGVAYHLLLKDIETVTGWALVGSRLVHYAVPPAFVGYWLLFVRRGGLGLAPAAVWLAFPTVYAAYTLIRGAIVGWYPYPFVDVATIGYAAVFRTAVLFVIGFATAGGLIVAVDWMIGHLWRGRRSGEVVRRN